MTSLRKMYLVVQAKYSKGKEQNRKENTVNWTQEPAEITNKQLQQFDNNKEVIDYNPKINILEYG